MAGGEPIDEQVAAQAAHWLTIVISGEASADELAGLQSWLAASPDHARAWAHLEAVTRRLNGLDPVSRRTIVDPKLHVSQRRKVLQMFAWLALTGGGASLAIRSPLWQETVADYHTKTGERRDVMLADGTRLVLNTRTSVNVDFDRERRDIALLAGEVLIVTGHALVDGRADTRPFSVRTAEGSVLALGTRFVVRREEASTTVAVLESRVRITPDHQPVAHTLDAGEQASFTRDGVWSSAPVDAQISAWTHGRIAATDMRLADFLAELSRYRVGFLRCDPAVADLRFSGSFPLGDTDRILMMLPNTLPVRVTRHTRYWVSVDPAA